MFKTIIMNFILLPLLLVFSGCFLERSEHEIAARKCFISGIHLAKRKKQEACSVGDFSCRSSCKHGYYFHLFSRNPNQPAPEAEMAVGKGLALGFNKGHFNKQLDDTDKSRAYVADGMGFARYYRMSLLNKIFSDPCPVKEFGDYLKFCQFGAGRAAFIKNEENKSSSKDFFFLGYSFASVFSTSTSTSSRQVLSIQKLVAQLKMKDVSENFKSCLEEKHLLECQNLFEDEEVQK